MPSFPSEVLYVCEIAAANEVEQQIVSLDEPSRTALFNFLEYHAIAIVKSRQHTRDVDTIAEVNPNPSTRLFDLTQRHTIRLREIDEVITQTTAAATRVGLALLIGVVGGGFVLLREVKRVKVFLALGFVQRI
ncbi:MAG TPA: hypothetical protein VGW58_08815 [Pyrinomonadaceae bacterium]|nr:hypothetical protein [Pyrinomonadaceae bacterium]